MEKNHLGEVSKFFRTERITDLGLNVDMTKFRMYDPALGRFWHVDPLADVAGQEIWTPYQFAYNNPIRYNDPYGDCPPGNPNCNNNGSTGLVNTLPIRVFTKVFNYVFNNPESTKRGLSNTSSASSLVETATEKTSKGVTKTLNKGAKKLGPGAAAASILVDAANTDFSDNSETADFVENTVQTTVGSTPIVGPGLDVVMDNAKQDDGAMNAKNLAKNFSVMGDATKKRTQERIQRLRNSTREQPQQTQQQQQQQTEQCDEDGCK